MADTKGRRKGSRNRGYFWRKERECWFTRLNGRMVPLSDEHGERMKNPKQPREALEDACSRMRKQARERAPAAAAGTVTVLEVCRYWLDNAADVNGTRESTLQKRADTLFDLCHGIYPKWRQDKFSEKDREAAKRDPKQRIHPGYGNKPAEELSRVDVLDWCGAHKDWTREGWRTRIGALKRAMNFAVEYGLIKTNLIRGMKVPQPEPRATYLSPEQEAAILVHCCRSLKTAIRVLIRTGMRPCEFKTLTAAHVVDHPGRGLEIRFAKGESKNNKPRTVRVTDAEIIGLVRKLVADHSTGPIFRNTYGKRWTVRALSIGFRRAKRKAAKDGVTFDTDCCLYSCRHTFAKRTLTGYWSGKPINMDMLAAHMGNTVDVCRKHYADLTREIKGMDDLLWATA